MMKVGDSKVVTINGRDLTVMLEKNGYMVWDASQPEPNFPYFVERSLTRLEATSCLAAAHIAIVRGL